MCVDSIAAVSYHILFFCGSFVVVQLAGYIMVFAFHWQYNTVWAWQYQLLLFYILYGLYHALPYYANYSVTIVTLSTNLEYIITHMT